MACWRSGIQLCPRRPLGVCCLALSSIDGFIIGDLPRACGQDLHTMWEPVEDAEWGRMGMRPLWESLCWEWVALCQLSWDSHWLKQWRPKQKREPPLLGTREPLEEGFINYWEKGKWRKGDGDWRRECLPLEMQWGITIGSFIFRTVCVYGCACLL